MSNRDFNYEVSALVGKWVASGHTTEAEIRQYLLTTANNLDSVEVKVGSHTTGGTGYITRIIKAAQDHGKVIVVVKLGEHQNRIYRNIKEQLAELERVAILEFNVTVKKEI